MTAPPAYAVVQLLDDDELRRLAEESFRCHADAVESRVPRPVDEDRQRGNPAKWLESAGGGPALASFYSSPHVLDALASLTGRRWQPSGAAGSFLYYRRPGHHLDLHRDIEACELAVVTCLYEHGAAGTGGMMCLYPERQSEPLAAIRATQREGALVFRLPVGHSLVQFGGSVAHAVLPVGPGHTRIVAPLCFRTLS